MPVINTDWWEIIEDVNENKSVGQVQVLQALGSEEQINNLKTERGFGKDLVISKFEHLPPKRSKNIHNETNTKQNNIFYRSNYEQCRNEKKIN